MAMWKDQEYVVCVWNSQSHQEACIIYPLPPPLRLPQKKTGTARELVLRDNNDDHDDPLCQMFDDIQWSILGTKLYILWFWHYLYKLSYFNGLSPKLKRIAHFINNQSAKKGYMKWLTKLCIAFLINKKELHNSYSIIIGKYMYICTPMHILALSCYRILYGTRQHKNTSYLYAEWCPIPQQEQYTQH